MFDGVGLPGRAGIKLFQRLVEPVETVIYSAGQILVMNNLLVQMLVDVAKLCYQLIKALLQLLQRLRLVNLLTCTDLNLITAGLLAGAGVYIGRLVVNLLLRPPFPAETEPLAYRGAEKIHQTHSQNLPKTKAYYKFLLLKSQAYFANMAVSNPLTGKKGKK